MHYFLIKIIHVVSAAILLGGGLFLFLYCLYDSQQAFKFALKVNLWVIAPAGFFQLLSGFAMIYLKLSYFSSSWIAGVLAGYAVSTLCWLSGIAILEKATERRYFVIWIVLCIIAFLGLAMVYDLMTLPVLP